MAKIEFTPGEYYHIFNRGVDKRNVFSDRWDIERFLQSMREFNSVNTIGSIYENSFNKNLLGNPISKSKKLVNFVCYCLNPNHYHFILEPLVENGVSKFMHKLGLGYSKYFNEKNNRTGALFQGKYKAIHIDSNEYLLYLSAYINLNDRIHQLGNPISKLVRSSWKEYSEDGVGDRGEDFCEKDIILGQFNDKKEYVKFAVEAASFAKENKDMAKLLLE
ncbi:MAG: transposase [Candidatus Niyogibacteria bacterium]|nr:transposase [Candidatus Niyogibacteria bacterium]